MNVVKANDYLLARMGFRVPKWLALLRDKHLIQNGDLAAEIEAVAQVFEETGTLPDARQHQFFLDYPAADRMLDPWEPTEADIAEFKSRCFERGKDRFNVVVMNHIGEGKEITAEWLTQNYPYHVPDFTERKKNKFEVGSVSDVMELIREHQGQDKRHIKTGYDCLDRVLAQGGWRPGAYYLFMGLTGIGKSIWLVNLAVRAWAQGKNVLFISTEMDYLYIYERILKCHYGARTLEEVATTAQSVPTGKIAVVKFHPHDSTTRDITEEINKLPWKPDLLITDYGDELKATETTANDYDRHGIIAADLKRLAEVHEVPVINATQTNRGAEEEEGGTKKRVSMFHVADSHKKLRLVEGLFSIVQTLEEKQRGEIRLQVAKNRGGASQGEIPFKINYETMRITEDDDLTKAVIKEMNEPEVKEGQAEEGLTNIPEQTIEQAREVLKNLGN